MSGRLSAAILAGFGTVLGLGLLEVGARISAVREEGKVGQLDRDLARIRPPAQGSTVTLGQIIRKSDNPRIVYELRSRLDVVFAGARLTTSDAGFRGRDVLSPKPPAAYRIVGIGDSYMFGQGVSDEETYLARLPALAHDSRPGEPVETVNLAVPGFNTAMEVELLRARAAALTPDLVLIEIVGNDLDLPNFLWNSVDPWSPRRSFLLDFIRTRVTGASSRGRDAGGLSEAPHEGEGAGAPFLRDPGQVPPQYASMVGLPAFERAIHELAELGRSRRFPVLAVTHGVWFEEAMLKALATDGIPVLVLRSALRQRARAMGAPDYARSTLALSPTDLHPSALGHRAVAEELAAWIRQTLPQPH
jgi:lysophospholipase L1-like esterase